jgi:acylphosphatase
VDEETEILGVAGVADPGRPRGHFGLARQVHAVAGPRALEAEGTDEVARRGPLGAGSTAGRRIGAPVIVSAGGRGMRVPACRYVVRGRVQGVGYRYFVLGLADRLDVRGFARNVPDGSVEVVAEGSEASLAELEARLREGPSFSEVTGVSREAIAERGSSGFHIR